jgi:ApaG protein
MPVTMSDTTTRGIRVQVQSFYDEERSSPQESYYFFAYRVRISNVGLETARLVSREWFITDGNGDTQRVQGPGVVGEQPVLAPGDDFEYMSFCPLSTAVGAMQGTYLMALENGDKFEAEIAPFSLAMPHAVN